MADRVAVVTGGAGGIGAAICAALLEQSWKVVSVDRTDAGASSGRADAAHVGGDVRDETVHAMAADAARRLGTLTAWVNCAGMLEDGALHTLDAARIDTQLTVNLGSVLLGCRAAVQAFIADDTPGSIVTIGSVHGARPMAGFPVYAAAKAGIEGLGRQLAVEYAHRGIRVNTIAPGAVRTSMTVGTDPAGEEERLVGAAALSPMNRVSEPGEVASLAVYLLSPEAIGITGTVVHLDNGMTAGGGVRP